MPTKRVKRQPQRHGLTPEALAAWRIGDKAALRGALGSSRGRSPRSMWPAIGRHPGGRQTPTTSRGHGRWSCASS